MAGETGVRDRLITQVIQPTESNSNVPFSFHQLTEIVGYNPDQWGPIEVDLSQLPSDAVESRVERKDSCGSPISELRIFTKQPVKIVIVPIARPK